MSDHNLIENEKVFWEKVRKQAKKEDKRVVVLGRSIHPKIEKYGYSKNGKKKVVINLRETLSDREHCFVADGTNPAPARLHRRLDSEGSSAHHCWAASSRQLRLEPR
jgi:hypothetical protein